MRNKNNYSFFALPKVDLFSALKRNKNPIPPDYCQLWVRADLDTSFITEKSSPQPEIKVHLEICFNFRSVLLDFQSFTAKPVFECLFAYPMILFLSYLVKNSIYRVSVIRKLAMKWYLMRMCAS